MSGSWSYVPFFAYELNHFQTVIIPGDDECFNDIQPAFILG
jgi:hypothetical protein